MDYLSRHPIIHDNETETQCEQDEKEAEDEFVVNQIYGLFEFNRTSASTTRYFEEPPSGQDLDQSQRSTRTREQDRIQYSVQTVLPPNSIKSAKRNKLASYLPAISKTDKVNGINMDFFIKRGHSPETHRLRQDRSKILQPNKTRIVGKGRKNERIQEYRQSQEGRKQTEKINKMIFNRCFQNSETLGSTLLKEFQENVNEALLNPSSDGESKINQLKQEKWPTKVLRIFRKHEGVYLFRLKQTAKQNTLQKVQNEKTRRHQKR